MNYPLIRSLLAGTACACLCGCLNLRPAPRAARYFVLTAVPGTSVTNSSHLAVGIGSVKLPDYLFRDSLAIRKGTNQIDYLVYELWAEKLSSGFQRVLAANLAILIPTDQVRLSIWRREEVAMGVYVTVDRFDVDTTGHGELVAWWRVVSPGGETLLTAGQFRASRQGPKPEANPQGATATLSELLADFSRDLAKTIHAQATIQSANHAN
jgi:uncharacterized protein